MKVNDIRYEIITGNFAIGNDGLKEPCGYSGNDWESYARMLENRICEGDGRLFFIYIPVPEKKQCMHCEKTVEYSSGVFTCGECSQGSSIPTDEEIEQVACDEMQQDWNDLAYQRVYHIGFSNGAKWFKNRIK